MKIENSKCFCFQFDNASVFLCFYRQMCFEFIHKKINKKKKYAPRNKRTNMRCEMKCTDNVPANGVCLWQSLNEIWQDNKREGQCHFQSNASLHFALSSQQIEDNTNLLTKLTIFNRSISIFHKITTSHLNEFKSIGRKILLDLPLPLEKIRKNISEKVHRKT